MTPRQEVRVLLGLFAQPVVAGAAAFVLFPALDRTASAAGIYSGRTVDPMGAAISIGLAAAVAAVPVVVFGALPAIAWLSHRRPISLSASLLAGALLGNAPAPIILMLATINGARAPLGPSAGLALVRAIAFGTCVGAVCGAVFRAIAGAPRRPWRGSSA